MKSTIDIKIEFYYKGELFAPSASIDLDQYMERNVKLPDLYLLLATENSIDSYSYHYEVMLQENIQFNNAKGFAAQFCQDGQFDTEAFQKAWIKEREFDLIQSIALDVLKIEDINQQPELKAALFLAYQEGKKAIKIDN